MRRMGLDIGLLVQLECLLLEAVPLLPLLAVVPLAVAPAAAGEPVEPLLEAGLDVAVGPLDLVLVLPGGLHLEQIVDDMVLEVVVEAF